MKLYPNILLIAGTGRNSGKTTLALTIIRRFSEQCRLVAVKISPHFHQGTAGLRLLDQTPHYNIYNETEVNGVKDSSRMLAAGSEEVFYVEVHDLHLQEAFEALMKRVSPSSPMLVESPALGSVIQPGLFFIVDHPQTVYKKADVLARSPQADRFINTGTENLDDLVMGISLGPSGWHFDQQALR